MSNFLTYETYSLFRPARKFYLTWGWSGGAMVLGKLPVPGRPTIWLTVGQGPCSACSRCGWGVFRRFYSPLSFLSSFSLSLGDGPI